MNLIDVINKNKTQTGSPMTATQVCNVLGLDKPTKATLNAVSKTLREKGLNEKRTSAGRFFYCEDWDLFFEKEKEEQQKTHSSDQQKTP